MSSKRKHSSKQKKRSKSRSRSRRSKSRHSRRDNSASDSDSPYRRGKKSKKRLKYSKSKSRSRSRSRKSASRQSLGGRKYNRQTCENSENFNEGESGCRNIDVITCREFWFAVNNTLFSFSAFNSNDQREIAIRSNFQVIMK